MPSNIRKYSVCFKLLILFFFFSPPLSPSLSLSPSLPLCLTWQSLQFSIASGSFSGRCFTRALRRASTGRNSLEIFTNIFLIRIGSSCEMSPSSLTMFTHCPSTCQGGREGKGEGGEEGKRRGKGRERGRRGEGRGRGGEEEGEGEGRGRRGGGGGERKSN